MPKGNCQFKGTGGQYFWTVFIHLILLTVITFGLYAAWAWVKILKLRASHTTINDKQVTFTGTGGQLLVLMLIHGLLTMVTFGFYFPWAISQFLKWKAANTLVGDKPGQFTGTGGSLFFFYLIHLMILPILTAGLYQFWGLYKLYAWKEEHTKYGGEKTSFGATFGGFLKFYLISIILNMVTLGLFFPWSLSMLFRWQINGLAVGNEEQVEHFPPVKTNVVVVALLITIGLVVSAVKIMPVINQIRNFKNMQPQVALTNMEALKKQMAVNSRIGKRTPRRTQKSNRRLVSRASSVEKSIPKKDLNDEIKMQRLNNFIDRDNQNADAYYNRGLLYANIGNLRMAEKEYSRAIEINKGYEDAYYNRGLVFVKMKKHEQAVSDFAQAITLKPSAVDAYCNRGNSNFQLGNIDLALDDFNAALKIDPNDADIYYNRAVAYLAKEATKSKAMVDFQKAAKLGHNKARKYLKRPLSKAGKSAIPLKTSSISRGMDRKNIAIPASTASGKIHGKNFKVENAKLENGILTLRQGKDFFPDLAVTIFLFLKKDENIEGKTFNISKDHGFGSGAPHIYMKWMPDSENLPKQKVFLKDYVLRLEFGKKEGNSLPGKIYLSLPDEFQSSIVGTFTSEVKQQ